MALIVQGDANALQWSPEDFEEALNRELDRTTDRAAEVTKVAAHVGLNASVNSSQNIVDRFVQRHLPEPAVLPAQGLINIGAQQVRQEVNENFVPVVDGCVDTTADAVKEKNRCLSHTVTQAADRVHTCYQRIQNLF